MAVPEVNAMPLRSLPDELWQLVCERSTTFSSEHFLAVAENLIKNPNITSSCVFRADVYYDSAAHTQSLDSPGLETTSGYVRHLRADYRPREFAMPGYELRRTVVRKMIPRNPAVDEPLIQTCHFFAKTFAGTLGSLREEDHVLLMIPHVEDVASIPFYHPKLRALALRHASSAQGESCDGTLSLHYQLDPDHPLDNRLERTAHNLLNIVHKHALGHLNGYQKRVHHDLIVPQNQFQDTYTRLKLKYAKSILSQWVESTDPTKHVFEDLGIAAFLIELWRGMYPAPSEFPGFVDIGCGNGLLVNILLSEGYKGWGFDARTRKSWSTYPEAVRDKLRAKILVPSILSSSPDMETGLLQRYEFHTGIFPPGTFIVSNHADELTPWTPLLAYLNRSPFIAIPCCSHDLSGSRCRFNTREPSDRLARAAKLTKDSMNDGVAARKCEQNGPGPRFGSLARPKSAVKQPSAYQSLTSYVMQMTTELDYDAAKEMLRIPSTRNAAIVGRLQIPTVSAAVADDSDAERAERVRAIVRREIGELEVAAKAWLVRADVVAKNKDGSH